MKENREVDEMGFMVKAPHTESQGDAKPLLTRTRSISAADAAVNASGVK